MSNLEKEKMKEKLTDIQYHVAYENGTEAPYTNEYHNHYEKGIYVDIVTKKPLFLSTDKFESGCGWPAFSKPIDEAILEQKEDTTLNRVRTEVRSKHADTHLGHVFNDGPQELGGMRYCINSAALKFIHKDKMEELGYGEYIKYIK